MELTGRTIAIVGGDEREQEIARCAAATGATVRGYGFPWPENGIDGVTHAGSAAEAMSGAGYALFPIPGITADGALFAPVAPQPIYPDGALLSHLRAGASIILGMPDAKLSAAAQAAGVSLVEYEHDTELMLLRGPAIVEGALKIAIENTEITLHNADIGVVGHGNIGRLLARTLVLLGARVQVFARNPVQRADALASGAVGRALDELPQRVPGLSMLFSTVPSSVVTEETLALMPRGLVMDLAAPPGGIDLAAAGRLGHRAIWARGLGRRAPITVGRSQWSGIERRIAEIEKERTDAR
ncbi:dipicolinate synthase subunit DpsA [Amycolatopsis jejuensis]|uniref:dipicolinate synthase subunit DpsA n=1 Tax=Amycolatopsis jejuensis TaxID=330084 RepID=UPI000524D4A7|nr:dipicolinate synthase subunit DpsA [Amycolatopsis jejuensis]